jgi:hypothetical protein
MESTKFFLIPAGMAGGDFFCGGRCVDARREIPSAIVFSRDYGEASCHKRSAVRQ